MKKITILVSLLLISLPVLANSNVDSQKNETLGLELLEDIANISDQRLNSLNCFDNASLCELEEQRLEMATNNLYGYNGELDYVRKIIKSEISSRSSYNNSLNCHANNDVCEYETLVINELSNVFLPEVNEALALSSALYIGNNVQKHHKHFNRKHKKFKRKHHKRFKRKHHKRFKHKRFKRRGGFNRGRNGRRGRIGRGGLGRRGNRGIGRRGSRRGGRR